MTLASDDKTTMTTTIAKADARSLTQAAAHAAEWGAEIEELHQKCLTSGAEAIRAMMDAGDRLQKAFESPERREHFPDFADWVRQFAHIAPRTADNYRRLAKNRDEIEAHIAQALAEGQSPTLNGAIAYLRGDTTPDDMPEWPELMALINRVGRLQKAKKGNALMLEPPVWAGAIDGLPQTYGSVAELWEAWKINGETWVQQVEAARQRALKEQQQYSAQDAPQGRDTASDEQTHAQPEQGGSVGQQEADLSHSVVWLDYADQAISIGCEVIFRGDEDNEIGVVSGFDNFASEVEVTWPQSGTLCHSPEALLVCSASQCVASEVEEEAQPAIAQHCSGREYRLFEDLPNKHYGLIYADPPWQYRDKAQAGNRGAEFKYQCLSLDALKQLPVHQIAADDCLLAMWWVPPMPMEALDLVKAWGFEFKTMKGFTWRKLTTTGLDHFGMGNYTRANTEDCLFAVKGKPERHSAAVRQLISAQVREHSRKPDEVRDALVQLLGDVPRIELFARQHAIGWDVWGNEAPEDVDTYSDVPPF